MAESRPTPAAVSHPATAAESDSPPEAPRSNTPDHASAGPDARHQAPRSRGLFIVFEGGDGVGKSTQSKLLARWLRSQGREAVLTFEPGDTAAGAKMREIVLSPSTGDLAPWAEALLYAADKAHHVYAVVRPALDRGAVVVSDRYVDSMLAYQGAGRVLDLSQVEQVARWATGDLRPDLTVVLDLDPAQGVGDIAEKDRLEGAGDEFHRRVRRFFLGLAARDPQHYLVLPARDSIEAIAAAVRARVASLLSEAPGTVAP